MNRFQRLLAMAGVGLLGAITVTGVMAGPGGVLGGGSSPDQSPPAAASADITTPDSIVAASEDSPDGDTEIVGDVIECPSGESTNFKFEQSADEFEVIGTLVSFDGTTIVVTGPEGDVTAVVDPSAEIKGDPQPGDAVKVEGVVVDGTSLVATEVKPACEPVEDSSDAADDDSQDDSSSESDACPSGENIQAEFEQDSHEFEVKGTLVSLGDGIVVVTGPDGDVTAALDPNAQIEGDPQPGDPVEVEGAVLEDGSLVAHEVEAACEDEDDDEDDSDDADEQDESDDDSSSSEDVQSDDDHGDSSSHDGSHSDSDDDSSGDHSEED